MKLTLDERKALKRLISKNVLRLTGEISFAKRSGRLNTVGSFKPELDLMKSIQEKLGKV